MRLHVLVLLSIALSTIHGQAQSSDKYLKRVPQSGFTLYFAKPVTLKSGGALFIPDFTYRHTPQAEEDGAVTINFSLFTREALRSVEALQLGSAAGPLARLTPTLLYLEQKKGKWHGRFTAELSFSDYLSLLKLGGDFTATLNSGSRQWRFPANRRWKKSAEVVATILESALDQR